MILDPEDIAQLLASALCAAGLSQLDFEQPIPTEMAVSERLGIRVPRFAITSGQADKGRPVIILLVAGVHRPREVSVLPGGDFPQHPGEYDWRGVLSPSAALKLAEGILGGDSSWEV